MTATGITWRPEIGDPTLMGWGTFIAYWMAAWLCARNGWWRRQKAADQPADETKLWLIFAGALLLLGVNKQLDLQTLLIQAGREIAVAGNWYQQRRLAQWVFVALLGSGLLGAWLLLCWKGRVFFKRHPFTLAGSILLSAFILLRTANIDHIGVDHSRRAHGMEICGILCFIIASLRTWTDKRRSAER